MNREKIKWFSADIAECAVFVALMFAAANISIPFFPVPLTFQTVICVLSGLLLGWKKGVISMTVYCFAGLLGIPVFANLGGGIAYVLRPTFGYILGFIAGAFTAGIIAGKKGLPFWRYLVAALAAFVANYAVGVPYFALVWQFYLRSPDLWKYIIEYNFLYMPKDIALCALAACLAWRVLPHIHRAAEAKSKLLNRE